MSTACGNGLPASLPCSDRGHHWSIWVHDETGLAERRCQREGCGATEVRQDWDEGGEA